MTHNPVIRGISHEVVCKTRTVVWVTLLFLFATTPGPSQSKKNLTYRLQAVYLLNFLKFAEWPDSVFENERSPIIVGVAGEDPFGPVLDEVVTAETIGERPITIIRFRTLEEITPCHVMYVCLSERENYSTHLEQLRNKPTLTVSEIDGFEYLGGCISFYLQDKKLRFAINTEALKESGVALSSKLLRFARIINPSRGS